MLNFLMLALGPVMFPPGKSARPSQSARHFVTATYAASALRGGLLGGDPGRLWLDLLFLAIFSLVALGVVGRVLDWRER